uniref:RING-type domain-containing protein n=1 Tax=Callorhinchus milii TaxID=7868 RepID=A0A4W3K2Y7_CALMI
MAVLGTLLNYDLGARLPSILPCLHTFCQECLANLALSHSRLVVCPLCRRTAALTEQLVVNTEITEALTRALREEEIDLNPEECPLCSSSYDDIARSPRMLECHACRSSSSTVPPPHSLVLCSATVKRSGTLPHVRVAI